MQISCGYAGNPHGQKFLTYYGPNIAVDVGFDPSWTTEDKRAPSPGIASLEALIDTGAEESCIDRLLAVQLGLPVVDRRPVCGVHGAKDVDMHLAQIHIPALKFTVHGQFAAVELKEGGHRQQVLLGRTFLQHFTLTYEGRTGLVLLAS